jgi:hypothetical protein
MDLRISANMFCCRFDRKSPTNNSQEEKDG